MATQYSGARPAAPGHQAAHQQLHDDTMQTHDTESMVAMHRQHMGDRAQGMTGDGGAGKGAADHGMRGN
jgi:hypothetical protein